MTCTGRPPGSPGRPMTLAAAALALASAALASTALAACPGAARASEPAPAGQTVWARTASGRLVPLARPSFGQTPVRPERLAHPGRDFLGSSLPARLRAAGLRSAATQATVAGLVQGIDVSSYQGKIKWSKVAPKVSFVYAKASEGTYYVNPDFGKQYGDAREYGVIRGAYHFGIPSNSSGQAQADYFIAHGGGWWARDMTLPGALDIEYNPYGKECYGLTKAQMVTWITDFVAEYAYKERVYPVIYSTTQWWRKCTGNTARFAAFDRLWIANYSAGDGGTLPSGWKFWTFWQYADSGQVPGDQDVFDAAMSRLRFIARRG